MYPRAETRLCSARTSIQVLAPVDDSSFSFHTIHLPAGHSSFVDDAGPVPPPNAASPPFDAPFIPSPNAASSPFDAPFNPDSTVARSSAVHDTYALHIFDESVDFMAATPVATPDANIFPTIHANNSNIPVVDVSIPSHTTFSSDHFNTVDSDAIAAMLGLPIQDNTPGDPHIDALIPGMGRSCPSPQGRRC